MLTVIMLMLLVCHFFLIMLMHFKSGVILLVILYSRLASCHYCSVVFAVLMMVINVVLLSLSYFMFVQARVYAATPTARGENPIS